MVITGGNILLFVDIILSYYPVLHRFVWCIFNWVYYY